LALPLSVTGVLAGKPSASKATLTKGSISFPASFGRAVKIPFAKIPLPAAIAAILIFSANALCAALSASKSKTAQFKTARMAALKGMFLSGCKH
jgi:hypothetical protein